MGVHLETHTRIDDARRPHAPWTLPLATDVSARDLKGWHDLLLRMPDAFRRGLGGGSRSNGDLVTPVRDHILSATPDLTTGAHRVSQAIERRSFNHDLLDTVLLHGQDRVAELIAVGEKILRGGVTISNPKECDFRSPLTLNDGTLVALRPDTIDALSHSSRYLLLRTQAWMGRFPAAECRRPDAPTSTKDIERALEKGLNRECARAYEVAVALASLPKGLRDTLLSMSPPAPCTPYAEAITLEFERDFQALTFAAWKKRKEVEPGGENHRSAKRQSLDDLSVGDQSFLHRLVRYRLDTLRRCGEDTFRTLVGVGEGLAQGGFRPLDRGELLAATPLTSIPLAYGSVSLDNGVFEKIAHADHSGWLHTVHFFDALGINELRQPRGAARGDGADVSYQDLPQSTRNRVRLNVATSLAELANGGSTLRHLERAVVGF